MTRSRFGWLRDFLGPAPLRPPGAKPEHQFTALCIRCNRCIEVCPYGTLKPAGPDKKDMGTPYAIAREIPCYLCMQCPPVCPSGALDPTVTDKRAVRMGIAVIDESTCYAFQGILCRTCVDECPLQGEAIYQNSELKPHVTDKCVGCGICERVCPASRPAIVIRPAGKIA
jgi:ferredoxin-type protein NapG